MGSAESQTEAFVRNFFATLSTGDLSRLRPLLHEDASWTVNASGIDGAGPKKGHKAILDDFLGPIRGIFEPGDPKVVIQRVIAQGNVAVAEARGLGRLKNGKEYNNRYAFVIEVRDGKVAALTEYLDTVHVKSLG